MSTPRPTNGRLYLLLSLMLLFWSFNYVVGKVALREFPPMLLVALRMSLSGVLILPIYLWRNSESGPSLNWSELRVLLPLGILGIGGNQLFFTLGLARTSVAHAAIVIATTPLLVLLLAAAIGQERVTAGRLLGMAVAFGGIVVLQTGHTPGSTATLLGDLYVFLGAASLAAFTVLGKPISSRLGGVTVNTVAYVGAGLLVIPFIFQQSFQFHFGSVSSEGWWSIFYMAAFSSVISYLIYCHALRHIAASRVSGFSYLQPVLATLMAVPLLREPVSPGLLVGGSLALAGVVMTERLR